jgi:hypothetical protein
MIKHLTPKSKQEVLSAFNKINWRGELNTEIEGWISNYFSQLETINNYEEFIQFLLNLSVKFPILYPGNIKIWFMNFVDAICPCLAKSSSCQPT